MGMWATTRVWFGAVFARPAARAGDASGINLSPLETKNLSLLYFDPVDDDHTVVADLYSSEFLEQV